jgi:hypothetical protein
MSFAEVLAAARELTADERKELLRELTEPMPAVEDDPLMRQFLATFPPGTEIEMNWPVEATARNIAALQRVLAEPEAQS